MFGGPPSPKTPEHTEDRNPVGDYKLVHDTAAIAEMLFASPGELVDLDLICPACEVGRLTGRANKYTRSLVIKCPNCTFQISR